jgi:hypothetical protein
MHIPEEAPPLNPWPFLAGDAALVATTVFIAYQAKAPLTGLPLIVIVCCVGLGAVLAIIPFLLNHTHRQDIALAERQREIAALAQTTAASAEQISIAATNLHSIVDATARALKSGEILPHKLQEKINDFKTQLNEVAVTENESLAQEINTLRTSETERLETALVGVRKAATELAALEGTTRKHLLELNESLARFTVDAGKSASDAAKTIDAARTSAEKSIAAAQAAALSALKDTIATSLTDLDRHFAGLSRKFSEQIDSSNTPVPENTSHKRSTRAPFTSATPAPFEAPAPVVSAPPPATHTERPFTRPPIATTKNDEPDASAAIEPAAEDVASALMVDEKPLRKRTLSKPVAANNELTLGIEVPSSSSEFSQITPDEATPAVSADGLTRLLVTAYIGIGNKLFVRGEGPGLSWDRGVPLQFVSIGKWRWESADATAPVQLKLYKNDELECTAVGAVTIAPGHQNEVVASFS